MTSVLNTSLRKAMLGVLPTITTRPLFPAIEGIPLFGTMTPDQSPDLSSLDDILHRIDRSNSWIYLHGLVPRYDLNGRQIENTKTPPWPWEALPPPVIKAGKKAWLTRDIDQWIVRMSVRAEGQEQVLWSENALRMEKAHG